MRHPFAIQLAVLPSICSPSSSSPSPELVIHYSHFNPRNTTSSLELWAGLGGIPQDLAVQHRAHIAYIVSEVLEKIANWHPTLFSKRLARLCLCFATTTRVAETVWISTMCPKASPPSSAIPSTAARMPLRRSQFTLLLILTYASPLGRNHHIRTDKINTLDLANVVTGDETSTKLIPFRVSSRISTITLLL
ncbi:hypothetical protein BJV74DRAFT_6081 [Russula compacta]|nr:hypothetical protein BJV74DRAFT_6081 [Russula compacta]